MDSKRPPLKEVLRMKDDGTLVEKYKNMVYKIAHDMRKVHPDENFNELVSEGWWGIMLYIDRYDPKKSTINFWIYKSAWDQMKTLCINPKTHRHIPTPPEDNVFERPEEEKWFPSLLKELTEDSILLVRAIVEAGSELDGILKERAPRSSAKKLKRYYTENFNWSKERMNRAWSEVQGVLS